MKVPAVKVPAALTRKAKAVAARKKAKAAVVRRKNKVVAVNVALSGATFNSRDSGKARALRGLFFAQKTDKSMLSSIARVATLVHGTK